MNWLLVYTKQASKDAKKIASSGLKEQTETLLNTISLNSYQTPPSFEKIVGDLSGAVSRRINIQHRLVYQVIEKEHTIKILRMWTHYE